MTTHHVSLYHPKTNQPESTVLKQELITYQQTSSGLTITKLERLFGNANHLDNYTSAPIILDSLPKQEGLLWEALPKKEG